MILFDFSAAFPWLHRGYVEKVLESMEVSAGMRAVVRAMYATSWSSVGRSEGASTPGFSVGTGVPQGCPLSGSVFACATVTLVQMLVEVAGASDVFLFADDTAVVVVDRVSQLVAIRQAFEQYKAATALSLKDTKCVLLPLLRA